MRTPLPINLDTLLRQRAIEGERVEYKAGWNPVRVLHTMCAFANDFHNLGGGYLVIGVEEANGRPVLPPKGIDPESVESMQKELLRLGHQAIQPAFHALSASYAVDGRIVFVAWAPGGETRPYKCRVSLGQDAKEWAWYIRRGSSTVRAQGAGLLFFNDEPHRFFPATQIDVVYFPDGAGGDRFEEKVFQGPLGQITRDAIDYVARSYLRETVVKHADRSEAERFWNFPRVAIEEAIVNAIYHRSYEEREPVEVRISPQDLVVLSFPGPDRSVRMEDLRSGLAVSRRYRNRRIGEFLKELDLTEGRSTGVPKILRAMKSNGSPPPEFESDEGRTYFLIRLPIHERAERSAPQVTPQVTPQVERLIVAIQGEMLRAHLMHALGLKDRMHFTNDYLQPALDAALVEMTIPDKPRSSKQRYRLTNLGHRLQAEVAARNSDGTEGRPQ